MNQNTIKEKWQDIKADLRKAWSRITDEEFEQTKGDQKSISGLIQKRYGDKDETYSDRLSDIFKKYEDDGTLKQ